MKKSQFNYVALCVSALLLVASCEQPHEHSWSQEYSHDTAEHWKTCSGCEEVSEKEAHSYGDWKEVVAATETAVGSKERSCTVCGYKETAEIPVLGHTHVWSETYSSDANHHWKTCSGCTELGSDGAHTYGDWTETVAATEQTKGSKERACTVCGYKETAEIPELEHTHVWSETYSSDDTHHWKTCSGCTELDSKAEHTYDEGVETTPATYTEKGVKTFACTVCGKTYTDDIDYIPVPKATTDKVIYDLTDKTSSDLMDDFVITKYGNNGWEAASATAKVVQDYKGNPAISFDAWSNYTTFKYSYNFGREEKAYGNIDFVAKGDDVITLKVQLMSSEHGVYATYDLGKLSSDYKEYSIFLKDSKWKVAYGGQTVTLDQLIQSEVLPMNDGTEMINMLAFDQINFIFYGVKANYGNSSVVLNNLKFKADGNASYAHEIFYKVQDSFMVESEGKYITLDIDYEAKTAKFKPDASQATEIPFTVSGNPEDGLLHFESEAAQVQLEAQLQKAGTQLKVVQVAGNGAAAFEPFVNGVLVHGAHETVDFTGLTAGGNMNSASWAESIWDNNANAWGAWKVEDGNGLVRIRKTTADNNVNINLYADANGRRYVYQVADSEGLARYFSIKVGNWWEYKGDATLRIILVTTTGEQIYALGSQAAGETITWTNKNQVYTNYYFDLGESGKKIAQIIFVPSRSSGDTFIYIDDIKLSYYTLGYSFEGSQTGTFTKQADGTFTARVALGKWGDVAFKGKDLDGNTNVLWYDNTTFTGDITAESKDGDAWTGALYHEENQGKKWFCGDEGGHVYDLVYNPSTNTMNVTKLVSFASKNAVVDAETGNAFTYNEAAGVYTYHVTLGEWGKVVLGTTDADGVFTAFDPAKITILGSFIDSSDADWTTNLYKADGGWMCCLGSGCDYYFVYNATDKTMFVGVPNTLVADQGNRASYDQDAGTYKLLVHLNQWGKTQLFYTNASGVPSVVWFDNTTFSGKITAEAVDGCDWTDNLFHEAISGKRFLTGVAGGEYYKLIYTPAEDEGKASMVVSTYTADGVYNVGTNACQFVEQKDGSYKAVISFAQWNNAIISVWKDGEQTQVWYDNTTISGTVTASDVYGTASITTTELYHETNEDGKFYCGKVEGGKFMFVYNPAKNSNPATLVITKLEQLDLSIDFESMSAVPSFVTYAPSNVYFKNVSGAGQGGSNKYLSIYSKGGNLVTFTLPQVGLVDTISFYTKNDFNGAVQTGVEVKVYDAAGNQIGEATSYAMAAGETWTQHTVTLPAGSNVSKITIGVKNLVAASGDTYAYLDTIVIG